MRRFKFNGSPDKYNWPINPVSGQSYTVEDIASMRKHNISEDDILVWTKHEEADWEVVGQENITFSTTITKDPVNPSHYKNGEVECIEAIKSAVVGKDGFEGYLVGNVIKYLWRFEEKGGLTDLDKSNWYLNKLIEYEKDKTKT